MPTGLRHDDDDAMQEILRRAMEKERTETGALQDRLLAAADELGISRDAVLQAEQEYRVESERAKELATYHRNEKKDFKLHLAIYVTVNVFLFLINMLTLKDDNTLWALFPLLGWGIGIVIHAISSMAKPEWQDEDFQEWRRERKKLEEE